MGRLKLDHLPQMGAEPSVLCLVCVSRATSTAAKVWGLRYACATTGPHHGAPGGVCTTLPISAFGEDTKGEPCVLSLDRGLHGIAAGHWDRSRAPSR